MNLSTDIFAIIKGPPMIFYFIIEEPLFANLQKKFPTPDIETMRKSL